MRKRSVEWAGEIGARDTKKNWYVLSVIVIESRNRKRNEKYKLNFAILHASTLMC